jgi:PAS domain S-box-containing protein
MALRRSAGKFDRKGISHVTSQLATIEATDDSNARTAAIVGHFQIGAWDWDVASDTMRWDAAMFRMYGLDPTRSEVPYEVWTRHLHPQDRDAFETIVRRASRDGGAFEAEFRIIREDGCVRIVGAAIATIRDVEGRLKRIVGVNRDVTGAHESMTQRARQNELLRLSEQRLRLLVEGIPDQALHALDPVGRVSSWNLGAQRILGYRAEQIIGRNFTMFFTREDAAEGLPAKALAQATQTGEYRVEGWRMRKNGTRFWAAVTIVALRDPQDGLVGFAQITRDLTERRAEEEHRRLIVEASPSGMVLVDDQGGITFANSAAETMFGYPQGGLVGRSVDSLILDRSRDEHPAILGGLGPGEQARRMGSDRKLRAQRRDGTEFPAEICLNTIQSSAGQIVVASISDITQRLLEEAELERSKALLDQTGEIARVGGWELNLRTREVALSAQARRILDVDPDSVSKLDETLALYTPDSRAVLERAITESMERGEGWDLELSSVTKQGRSIFVRALGAVEFENGAPARLVGALQDITESKRAQLQLVETFSRLRNWFASASEVSIIASDQNLIITLFNAGAERLLGYASEEVTGRATFELFHDRDEVRLRAEELTRSLGRPVEGGAVFTEPSTLQEPREWTFVRKDSRRVRVSLVVTAVRSDAGDLLGYLGIARDVTREKEVEEKLREATFQAEHANMAKSAFLASMSHEIRTPMNGVIGFADLLLDSKLTEQQRSHTMRLQDAAKSLLSLMNDILDISKIEAGKLEIETIPMSPVTVVHGAASIVRTQLTSKGLELRIERGRDVPDWIESDPTRVRQILLNLLSNALKFTDHGRITVRSMRETFRGEAFLRFEVEDQGIGIPADRQHLMFQNFSQVDRSTTRRYGGTGLGLSICKRLAQAMGGDIGLRSVPGMGATIWFTIKLRECAAPDLSAAQDSTALVANPARVLVADDLEMNRDIVTAMLTGAGHSVLGVDNGRQAVAAVHQGDFDLVLMDMEMPEMDGVAATRAIRRLDERVRHIPIIALTANAFSEDQQRCRAAGMNDFLPKPMSRDGLLAMVAKWSGGTPRGLGDMKSSEIQVLDPAVLDAFDAALGAARAAEFSGKFREQVREALAVMTLAEEPAAIAREAHKLLNIAGNLGCVELAGFARNLCSEAKRENGDLDSLLIDLPATVDRAVAALDARYA